MMTTLRIVVAVILWTLCSIEVSSSQSSVSFQAFPNISACHDKSGTENSLIPLSPTSTFEECLDLAANRSCYSVCWSKQAKADNCHCHVTPIWMPLPNTSVDSAVLDWPCTSPKDCSYNGICHTTSSSSTPKCHCHAGWDGVRCGALQFLPVDKDTPGFRQVNATTRHNNISTWGASILWDHQTQQWHGWVSEIVNECGINAWNVNSQIVHITSHHGSPSGPFQRQDIFATPFAHEPSVTRGPRGEWVMLYSAYNNLTRHITHHHEGYNASTWQRVACTNCSQGASLSPVGSKGCPFQRGQPTKLNHLYIQMMAIASHPNGPWRHVEIPKLTMPWDWNTAMTIRPNSEEAIALIRGGMVWHAHQYDDPHSWHPLNGRADPDDDHQPSPHWPIPVEDPYIWYDDTNGVYHALAHCFDPFFGVHAYAADDKHHHNHSSLKLLNWTVTGVAYDNVVHFTDGTQYAFGRRERPFLIWGKMGQLVALSNGVAYGTPNPFAVGHDMTFTLIAPIVQQQQEAVTK
ncbi:expressed unknown protein [Seminavis robusta]|uniref:EGF-like domain-containing protein n=1 Tax=Seminavis robusta TaxID=568900 RepID=A0A9N8ESY5_9STRA|nr:expressed unknown protein [Seminavis robusta]|eukprot:Sro1854_g301890.1 n/a (518) ;mRNA; f:16437-17990